MKWAILVLVACHVPTPSDKFACRATTDCDTGRVCQQGFCVISDVDAGVDAPGADAHVTQMDAAVDAGPVVMTFNVGTAECNAGRCKGGYGGVKDTIQGPATSTQVCKGHSFPRATAFTFVTSQPGGKFCVWNNGAWGCDSSCSGCNPMDTVTCSNP